MIVTQAVKADQAQERFLLKNAEATFAHQIVEGTNCSPFESQIIVTKAKEAFRVGEWSEGRILDDGQMVFHALSALAPPGVPVEKCPKVRVVLSFLRRKEDLEVQLREGASARRRQQILRLAVEAQEQGGLLTQEDLAFLLGRDVRTIRADIATLREQQLVIPTRGTVRDIGPGVTHKQRAVRLWLEGKEPLEVAQHLNHSLTAVERYVQTFCRVVYAHKQLRDLLGTALVVGISLPAAQRYWALHEEMMQRDPFYQRRLDEVLRLGEIHWQAVDEKRGSV